MSVDEHPDSINDGALGTIADPTLFRYIDWPANLHAGGCGFSFCDGHAEIHKWITASLKIPVRHGYGFPHPYPTVIGGHNNADLLWWKGEQIAIVEVSLQVDRQDVSRAERCANTLKCSGTSAIAIVIGEQWATPEAREQAQIRHVEWKVDADLSEGFLSFRRQ